MLHFENNFPEAFFFIILTSFSPNLSFFLFGSQILLFHCGTLLSNKGWIYYLELMSERKHSLFQEEGHDEVFYIDDDNSTIAFKEHQEVVHGPADQSIPAVEIFSDLPAAVNDMHDMGLFPDPEEGETQTVAYQDPETHLWFLRQDYRGAHRSDPPVNSDTPDESESHYQVSDPTGWEVVEDDTTPVQNRAAIISTELDSEETPFEEQDLSFFDQGILSTSDKKPEYCSSSREKSDMPQKPNVMLHSPTESESNAGHQSLQADIYTISTARCKDSPLKNDTASCTIATPACYDEGQAEEDNYEDPEAAYYDEGQAEEDNYEDPEAACYDEGQAEEDNYEDPEAAYYDEGQAEEDNYEDPEAACYDEGQAEEDNYEDPEAACYDEGQAEEDNYEDPEAACYDEGQAEEDNYEDPEAAYNDEGQAEEDNYEDPEAAYYDEGQAEEDNYEDPEAACYDEGQAEEDNYEDPEAACYDEGQAEEDNYEDPEAACYDEGQAEEDNYEDPEAAYYDEGQAEEDNYEDPEAACYDEGQAEEDNYEDPEAAYYDEGQAEEDNYEDPEAACYDEGQAEEDNYEDPEAAYYDEGQAEEDNYEDPEAAYYDEGQAEEDNYEDPEAACYDEGQAEEDNYEDPEAAYYDEGQAEEDNYEDPEAAYYDEGQAEEDNYEDPEAACYDEGQAEVGYHDNSKGHEIRSVHEKDDDIVDRLDAAPVLEGSGELACGESKMGAAAVRDGVTEYSKNEAPGDTSERACGMNYLTDEKVGSILIPVFEEGETDHEKIAPGGTTELRKPALRAVEKERRYVYRSSAEGALYYLTRTRNRALVVDPTRIEYFPGGVEPEHLKGTIVDYAYSGTVEEENNGEAEKVAEVEVEPWLVGNTIVQVPKIHPFTKAATFKKVKREVYTCGSLTDSGETYYFTQVGGRRIAVEPRRVFFFTSDPRTCGGRRDSDSEDSSDSEHEMEDKWKVGTITVKKEACAGVSHDDASTVRTVFCSPEKFDGEPFYLTLTGNAILVLDPNRIQYDAGKMPMNQLDSFLREKERRKRRKEERRRERAVSKAELQKKMLFVKEHGNVVKVGVMYLRVPQGNGGLTSRKKKQDVYCSVLNECEKPFYFSSIGSKIYVTDNTRIRYLLPDGTDPPEVEPAPLSSNIATQYLQEITSLAEKEMDDEESVDLNIIGPGDDEKIGTITVQKALKPGEKVKVSKEVLDVYGTSPFDNGPRRKKKPYMLTTMGKRIYVENRSAIRYLPKKETPMMLEKRICENEILGKKFKDGRCVHSAHGRFESKKKHTEPFIFCVDDYPFLFHFGVLISNLLFLFRTYWSYYFMAFLFEIIFSLLFLPSAGDNTYSDYAVSSDPKVGSIKLYSQRDDAGTFRPLRVRTYMNVKLYKGSHTTAVEKALGFSSSTQKRFDHFSSNAVEEYLNGIHIVDKPLRIVDKPCCSAQPYDAWKVARKFQMELHEERWRPQKIGHILVQQKKGDAWTSGTEVNTRRDAILYNGSGVLIIDKRKIRSQDPELPSLNIPSLKETNNSSKPEFVGHCNWNDADSKKWGVISQWRILYMEALKKPSKRKCPYVVTGEGRVEIRDSSTIKLKGEEIPKELEIEEESEKESVLVGRVDRVRPAMDPHDDTCFKVTRDVF
eukprot:gene9724-6812_t